MKKRWGIWAAVILLALPVVGWLWLYPHPRRVPVIRGSISPGQLAEIRKAVKQDLRRKIFPTFSWANIKRLPARGKWYFGQEVARVDASRPGHVYVTVAGPDDRDPAAGTWYDVVRGTNGWKAYQRPEGYDFF